ncbi:uncharacterized protein LOC127689649 [Apodemus sylvaticus]|uniref:uncharacterized protein LOC127689649 n=1 Tax=Apodemus sylvaticus TaxID=10129 RepID=UPI002244B30C|nr:uncharacterized protein LOC127689649 [Apodemus sylvaticus]
MPRAKERKQKPKGAAPSVVPVLQKFLKTYQKHCLQSRTSLCPAIQRDLKSCIDREQILRKFMLVRAGNASASTLPVSLEPLLMTIRDESYTLAKEICIWGLHLTNPEIARLALFLEQKGHTTCPVTTLEIIDCKMDLWSLGRLGKALQFSSLHFLVLDYCRFGNEELESIFSGLESNQRLQGLSMRYCGLGPQSGQRLGSVISRSAIWELRLDGNDLQCSGACALLRPIAEYAETQGKEQPTLASAHTGSPPQLPQVCRGASSTLSQIVKSSEALTARRTSQKKSGKGGIWKQVKSLRKAGPWIVTLSLADNGIDGTGKDGERLPELTRTVTCLIKHSAHLREMDLGNNVLGETAAADILEALRARKMGKLPPLKVTVTPRISSDTFRSIWKLSKKSKRTRKKKKKVNSSISVQLGSSQQGARDETWASVESMSLQPQSLGPGHPPLNHCQMDDGCLKREAVRQRRNLSKISENCFGFIASSLLNLNPCCRRPAVALPGASPLPLGACAASWDMMIHALILHCVKLNFLF